MKLKNCYKYYNLKEINCFREVRCYYKKKKKISVRFVFGNFYFLV